jgi:hypothetical protein
MRTRSLILLVMLVTLSGCVVTYHHNFTNVTLESPLNDHNVLTLPVKPGFEQCDLQQPLPQHVGWRWFEAITKGIPVSQVDSPRTIAAWLQGVRVPVQDGQVVFVFRPNQAEASPQEGLACIARITTVREKATFMGIVNGVFSVLTFFIIPLFEEGPKYSVTFSVFKGQQLMQEYQYSFTKGIVEGLLVLPFTWIDFFTSSVPEAFQIVAQQFLFDLQRDGNL